ncbi:MAG TPA: metallophosphoesterase family protein [Candidatus Acidoferrum sp.]|nr:metallophosphoesterase family protein [Candidatus Acidoferrum sp.]
MRTLAHLSDLHFGRIEPATVQALLATVTEARPDVVVVSGDLTQRAKEREFQEARRFLDALPSPQIVVPGNHDVPLYNVLARTLKPLRNYQRYITQDLEPFYFDDEITIVGINTARSLTFKSGRINRRQVARSCARLEACGENRTRIIISHHPFDLPESRELHGLVGRAHMAMAGFARCRVDLILSGHLHISHTSESAPRYKIPGHSALVIHAGTATSSRARGELNSFNILQVDRSSVSIQCLTWNHERGSFLLSATAQFHRTPAGWSRIPPADAAPKP